MIVVIDGTVAIWKVTMFHNNISYSCIDMKRPYEM
jgi:hypothetical protein